MATKKIKLTALERRIEAEAERGEWIPASAEFTRQVIEAAKRPAIIHHGGARPGAGRKPTGRRPVLVRLEPKTEARIRAEARRKGVTLGAVIDQWAMAA